MPSEFDYISWIRGRTRRDARVPIGIGDDTAAVAITPGRQALVTTDMLLEGIHFDRAACGARAVGRKAMAVNLSDMAAMAGVPIAAVVALALPRPVDTALAEALDDGLRACADEYGVVIAGGDTNASPNGLVVAVTLIGETTLRGAVRRGGARVGDTILVSGTLGGSILGKHLDFTPRVREALRLHECYELHAMIDLSDGLAADLGHILAESGCAAVLRAADIPISDASRRMADPLPPLEHALRDGEDFELLFTLAPDDARRLVREQPLPVPVCAIGEISSGSGIVLEQSDGVRVPLESAGYDHFRC